MTNVLLMDEAKELGMNIGRVEHILLRLQLILLRLNILSVNDCLNQPRVSQSKSAITNDQVEVHAPASLSSRSKATKSVRKVCFADDVSPTNTDPSEDVAVIIKEDKNFYQTVKPAAGENLDGYMIILSARRQWLLTQDLENDAKLRTEWMWLIKELDANMRIMLNVNERGIKVSSREQKRGRSSTMSTPPSLVQASSSHVQPSSRERGMSLSKPVTDHLRLRGMSFNSSEQKLRQPRDYQLAQLT